MDRVDANGRKLYPWEVGGESTTQVPLPGPVADPLSVESVEVEESAEEPDLVEDAADEAETA